MGHAHIAEPDNENIPPTHHHLSLSAAWAVAQGLSRGQAPVGQTPEDLFKEELSLSSNNTNMRSLVQRAFWRNGHCCLPGDARMPHNRHGTNEGAQSEA